MGYDATPRITTVERRDPSEQQRRVDEHFQREADYWRDIYQLNDVFATIHRERRSLVLAWVDSLGLAPGSRILEIGCGAGLMTVALAQRGCFVDAVDTVDAMLSRTCQSAAEAGVGHRVRTTSCDAHQLSFKDNSFVLVVAIGVIPWLHEADKALHEMARVLEVGGYLIVNADNRWRLNDVVDPRRFPPLARARWKLRDALERLGLSKPVGTAVRSRAHSMREFDGLLARAGLGKERAKTLGFGPFSFFNCRVFPDGAGNQVHRKLQGLADRGLPLIRSTGAQYVVLSRKNKSPADSLRSGGRTTLKRKDGAALPQASRPTGLDQR